MAFDQVKLSSVLTLNTDFVEDLEDQNYNRLSVRLYGNGIEVGEVVHANSIVMKKHQIVKTGQVVLSMMWGKKGAIGVVPNSCDGGIITTNFYLFDINTSKIETTFLNWIFRANYLEEQLMAVARGTASNATTRPKQLLACSIPLPPLTEQRRIVTRIEALAARVTAAQSLRREASEEANSLEHSFIDKVYKACAEKLGTLELAAVCDTLTDGDHITPSFSDEGVKFIFVGNVSSGVLHFRNCKYVTPEYFEVIRPQRKAKLGDILYSAVGATLGIPAIVDKDEDFCFQRHIAIIKPNRSKLDSKFLWYMLRSTTVFKIAWANTTGSAQPTVPLNAIRKIPIPVPPLPEQRRLVAYLDGLQAQVTSLRAAQAESERALSALMPSVLDRAFKGEL